MACLKNLLFIPLLAVSFTTSLAIADIGEQFDDIIEEIVPKTEISNQQLRALRQELKIQRIFIEAVKGIEIRGGEFANLPRSASTIEELILSSFGAKSSSLPSHLQESLKTTMRASINKSELQKALIKLKDFVWKQAAGKKVMLTSTARRFGFDVGLVYLLSLQVDLTFPTVMMAMGHMEFAPLLVTPVSSIATGSYAAIKSGVKMRQLVKNLGGMTSAREHFNIYRNVKRFFQTSIFPRHEIVDIGIAGKTYTLTLEKQNLLSRFKQRLGWNKNLNFKNLLSFMQTENLMTSFLDKVVSSNRPEQVKLLRVLYRLEKENDPEIMLKLRERFGNYIQEMNALPDFGEGRKWAARIGRASTFDEFSRLMMNIPDDIPPKVFDRLWRNHIIPEASRNIGPFINKDTYKAFRNLENNWQKGPRKALSESVETSLGEHWKKQIAEYFFQSLAPVNGCSAIFTRRGDYVPLL